MRLLEVTPAPCLICGKGNTPDSNGDRLKFVDLERDVNWNDPAILCEDCLANAAGLVGMLSKDTLREMKVQLREKDKELHDAKVAMDQMKRRAKRLGVEFTKPETISA